MNYKKTGYYVISIIIVILIVHAYMKLYLNHLMASPFPHEAVMNSLSEFSLKHFGSLVVNVIMGMVFGIESFIKNVKKNGQWHVNVQKLLIIGIPSLILSIEFFHFHLLRLPFVRESLHMSIHYLIAPAREPFFRFLLGYTILTSFYKEGTPEKDSEIINAPEA